MGLKNFGFIAEEFVIPVRTRFITEFYEENPDDYDEVDIQNVINDDWIIKRFLILAYKNENDALLKMDEALKWRKSTGRRELKDNYFPAEFFETGALFINHKPDRNGLPSLVMRLKYFKRIPEMLEEVKRFCIHSCYKIDEGTNGRGWCLIMDFTDCGYSHYSNLDVLHYFVTTMHYYFPAGMDYVIAVDVPWMLSAAWSIVKMWLPEKRREMVKFSTRDTLEEFFHLDNLPSVLGGFNSDPDFKRAPIDCPTAVEFGQSVGVQIDRCYEIIEEFKPLIADSMNEP